MEQAWLDSLSEDWISQPRASSSPTPSLPSTTNTTSDSSNVHPASSLIPKYNPQKKAWTAAVVPNNNSPLSERSLNDSNIPLSQRAPKHHSKLRDEVPLPTGSQRNGVVRRLSESTTRSTHYHTVQHTSVRVSPSKGENESPEWKRRLLQGDVAYGEQRDLFSAAGLETIFRPPSAQAQSPGKLQRQTQIMEEPSVIMPSSPPPYNLNRERDSEARPFQEDMPYENDQEGRQPREQKYKLNVEEGTSGFSTNDLSRSSNFQPRMAKLPASQGEDPAEGTGSNLDSSISQLSGSIEGAGRIASGQSDIRNEELSPIYISRHNTVNAKIDYAVALPAAELQKRLEEFGEINTPGVTQGDNEASHLILEGMAADSDDYAHNGRFVNLRRGGRSQEGSFQRRMLSPSSLPAIDESAMLPEESMQASTPKQLPHIKKTRVSQDHPSPTESLVSSPIPHTPHESPNKSNEKHHEHSSGSPLKIFGTYDTFTNQKLLRRLSQFEGDLEGDNDEDGIHSASAQERTDSELNEAFVSASSPQKMRAEAETHQRRQKKFNSFGEGELDGFQFSEGVSYSSNQSNDYDDDKENTSLPALDGATRSKFQFQLEPSPALEEGMVASHRTKFSNMSTTKHTRTSQKTIQSASLDSDLTAETPPSQRIENLETPRKRNGSVEGKRIPKSPLKDPTPKRRRTLQSNDVNHDEDAEVGPEADSVKESHQQMQSVIGKKRRDARHGDNHRTADPNVLSMRQMLQAKRLSSNQKIYEQKDTQPTLESILTPTKHARLLQQKKIAQVQAELDSAETHNAPTKFGTGHRMADESRKGSVTTQDFLDEAKKIMAGIRGKVRPRSGLASLEESESENDRNQSAVKIAENGASDDSFQESTQEPFSRPPSRDGGPVSRPPPRQEDPELLIHLRKYQEMSDVDGVISSLKSMAISKGATTTTEGGSSVPGEALTVASDRPFTSGEFIESEPSNIRISESLEFQRKRKHSSSSSAFPDSGDDDAQEAGFMSHGSNASSNQSTSRSIPTGSSRGSDSRRIIAPHTVSHLIPEQLAGMIFDRERNIWVKRKNIDVDNGSQNVFAPDETEDDPFGDIPDLSVDEAQELERIKVAAELKQKAHLSESFRIEISEIEDATPTSSHVASSGAECEPFIGDKASKEHAMEGDGVSEKMSHIQNSDDARFETEAFEEVEREISIHEDRIGPMGSPSRRNITISFSSPLTSVIHPPTYDQQNGSERNTYSDNGYDNEDIETEGNDSAIVSKKGKGQRAGSTKTRTAGRKLPRHVSLGGHRFAARPVSRIDEQDENFSDEGPDDGRSSISVIVATPILPRRSTSLVLVTPRPSHEVGNLSLSPLSDFTIHQEDESFGLNVSYVAGGQHYAHGNSTRKTLSLAIKELVQKITEVEPYEPFWEHMKQLDLSDRKLHNLHKFDEFCGQLEDLDVSHNQINQLDGVPRTVRHLQITHNCLSDLTSWGHLSNLQYVDVSNNQLESLSAFKSLVHLRGLRADNNMIKSLDPIGQLDGLLSLRLRGNLVESIDFEGTRLQRLTDLDLRGNRICEVQYLNELASLSDLDLEDNILSKLSVDESRPILSLKSLRLSGNDMDQIDLSPYPNLRLLYLDRNRLGKVKGLIRTKRLDSLSIREQKNGAVIDLSFLSEALEVRKLFLSGNLIHNFAPGVNFLNLQYLELANCGLQSLPSEFGQMVLNTRVLNLNFNALTDIAPLLGIVRLKKLHIAGNRISSLRRTTSILSQHCNLTLVDLRANPLTLGFYPPVLETSLVSQKCRDEADIVEPFTIGQADRNKDTKYAACLDMPTKMLRRVFEMLVLSGCFRLKILDGMGVDRSVLEAKDEVWKALVTSDILVTNENERLEDGGGVVKPPEETPEPSGGSIPGERWPAEDSFA